MLWGPAQVMRSLIFGYVTDIWGDVPYSRRRSKGTSEDAIIQPAYDAQQDIYAGLFTDLNDAVTAMAGREPGGVLPTVGWADPIFGGNRSALAAVRQFAPCPPRDAARQPERDDGAGTADRGDQRTWRIDRRPMPTTRRWCGPATASMTIHGPKTTESRDDHRISDRLMVRCCRSAILAWRRTPSRRSAT